MQRSYMFIAKCYLLLFKTLFLILLYETILFLKLYYDRIFFFSFSFMNQQISFIDFLFVSNIWGFVDQTLLRHKLSVHHDEVVFPFHRLTGHRYRTLDLPNNKMTLFTMFVSIGCYYSIRPFDTLFCFFSITDSKINVTFAP